MNIFRIMLFSFAIYVLSKNIKKAASPQTAGQLT